MKRALWIMALTSWFGGNQLEAQILASFSLSQNATSAYGYSDAGWTNLHGDPLLAVRTATANGITLSSVRTANWVSNNSACAEDGVGASPGTFFPTHILACHWYQASNSGQAVYNPANPQLELSGLNKDSFYILRMSSSSSMYTVADPTQYTVAGSTVAPSQNQNSFQNTSTGVTFEHIYPDSNGDIKIYVNTTPGKTVAYLAGVQVISGTSTVGIPQVSITSPANGDIIAEESNITINASASETAGSISKVEFYEDTTKIGEADSPPYKVTWLNPNEGSYTITAKATDASGTASAAMIHISLESLSSFWSTTGNIHMNADSNFVGNVDSVRLAFRTKDLERMSISPTGNVGIGTISPSAQLHTTGTVRLAGLTGDSTKTRVLVSDSSGNLFYRNLSSLGTTSRWLNVSGSTVYDSTDNIGIGTSNTQGYKLAVNGTAIFQKIKVVPGPWPDYVFEPSYRLLPLPELERYIARNKHLPDIAAEEEVKKEGQDIGENVAGLLRKLEELTLYVIELNKKVEKLSRENEELKKKMHPVIRLNRK